MNYWQKINPTGAIADFRQVFHQAGPARWPIAAVSILITVGVFSTLAWESWKKPRPLPEVTYINSWPVDRTEAETEAFIKANQKVKEEREARIEEYEKTGRDLWATLGKASGMDVEKMQKEADAERAAEKARQQAEAEAILKRAGAQPAEK